MTKKDEKKLGYNYSDFLKDIQIISEIENKRIKEMTQDLVIHQIEVAKSLGMPLTQLYKKFTKTVNNFRDAFSKDLTEGIKNFDVPEKYDTKKFVVMEWVETQAYSEAESLLEDFSEKGVLPYYNERYKIAYEYFRKGDNYYLPIFTFISIQDGLMTVLCNLIKEKPKGGGGKHFTKGQKFDALMKKYNLLKYIIENKIFRENLEKLYAHRNEIMHGGKYAQFDKNIAIISLLFLTFTQTVVRKEIISNAKEKENKKKNVKKKSN